MKSLDFLWLAAGIFLTVFSGWAVAAPTGNSPPRLEVQTDSGLYLYPLDKSQIIAAKGPLGVTHIHIEAERALGGSQAWVSDSPCKNKICIQMGKISQPGQWVACLPNHIFARITGTPGTNGGLDVSVY